MTDAYHRSIYLNAYAKGYALHLITWTPTPEDGTPCGRQYPLSAQWQSDMIAIAKAFSGGPLYVTLFTEFQTYPCIDNQWAGASDYYTALIAQYEKGIAIFHQYAPGSKVSLGWGGWQVDWDDPANGGGRSLFPYFAQAMRDSDFTSFQAMKGTSNVADIQQMSATLGAYRPVMLAHHMPDADTNDLNTVYTVFANDIQTLLTSDSSVASLTQSGLFAWSFLNDNPMQASTTTFDLVKTAVTRYGK